MNWIIDDEGSAKFVAPRGGWRVSVDPARPQAGLCIDRAPASSAESAASDAATGPAASIGPVGTLGFRDTSGEGEPGSGESLRAPASASPPVIRLLPPPGQQFPPLVETYPRGGDLIASLPQTAETEFGLSLCHRVLRADDQWLVCETIVAVQTDLLDSHPTLDLVADTAGEPLRELSASIGASGGSELVSASERTRQSMPPPVATRLERPGHTGACFLLLPPSDRAAAEDRGKGSGSPICYRLLAEFLEKGVIRKARFWTCRSAGNPAGEEISALYAELMHLPLPLTP